MGKAHGLMETHGTCGRGGRVGCGGEGGRKEVGRRVDRRATEEEERRLFEMKELESVQVSGRGRGVVGERWRG